MLVDIYVDGPMRPEPQDLQPFRIVTDLAEAGACQGMLALSSRRVDSAVLEQLPALEIIANFGVGYDRVDMEAALQRGLMVTNTPEVLDEEVADLTLGLLLATVRRLPQADRFVRAGQWLQGAFPLSGSLRGKRVGILGLGRIGKAIARRCAGFGLDIAYHGRKPQPAVEWPYHAAAVGLAEAVDILVVIAPATPETRNIVDAKVLDALGPAGTLINVSRGSLVDQEALIAALENGRLAAAGLDVFPNEPQVDPRLCALENVVLLPHVGSATTVTRSAMLGLALDNLRRWFDGHGPLTPVPECRSPI